MQTSAAGQTIVPVLPQGLTVTYQETSSGQVLDQAVTQAISSTQIEEAHSTTSSNGQVPPQGEDSDGAIENDKKAIYSHPLFPLMALFFEKCEQATQTPDCPSSNCFDVDIQAFVQRQERERKPFFSDNPELDGLMIKAIQVLRIHLLELEKVNELCKDFCNRYIACLKGKLQSEQLLRVDGIGSDGGDDADFSPPPASATMPMTPTVQAAQPDGTALSTAAASAGLAQGQIVSGGTVYQMVQTPHGLVAQPIQIPPPLPVQTPQPTTPTTSVIPGSMPLSQIGTPSASVSTPTTPLLTPGPILVSPSLASDDEDMSRKKSKRGVLPKHATQVMKSWLFQHIVHPYPTEDEKRHIATQTNLSLLQVNNWFINARRRILQPMLDASNPDGSKAKKPKNQSRPVQRFWPENIATLQQQVHQLSKTSTEGGGDDVTSSPNLSETEGLGEPAQQQVMLSEQATVTLAPQPIVLPPGVTLTADGQLINMSGAMVGALSITNSGLLADPAQLSSMLAAVATGNSLLSTATVATAMPNGEHTTQPNIIEEPQQVESDR